MQKKESVKSLRLHFSVSIPVQDSTLSSGERMAAALSSVLAQICPQLKVGGSRGDVRYHEQSCGGEDTKAHWVVSIKGTSNGRG
jgi:hypothetical protein